VAFTVILVVCRDFYSASAELAMQSAVLVCPSVCLKWIS